MYTILSRITFALSTIEYNFVEVIKKKTANKRRQTQSVTAKEKKVKALEA